MIKRDSFWSVKNVVKIQNSEFVFRENMWWSAKGQLISKANCQAVNSSKKRTNEFVFTTMRGVFVRFLEEIEDTKKTFGNYLTFSWVVAKHISQLVLRACFFSVLLLKCLTPQSINLWRKPPGISIFSCNDKPQFFSFCHDNTYLCTLPTYLYAGPPSGLKEKHPAGSRVWSQKYMWLLLLNCKWCL